MGENRMKITTKSGFKFELDERIIDDWRVVKAMGRADNTDNPEDMLAGSIELISLIFGKDEDRLVEHIRKKNDGYAPMAALKDELLSTFERVKALKNSKSSQA